MVFCIVMQLPPFTLSGNESELPNAAVNMLHRYFQAMHTLAGVSMHHMTDKIKAEQHCREVAPVRYRMLMAVLHSPNKLLQPTRSTISVYNEQIVS